jgi:hypothetical protein
VTLLLLACVSCQADEEGAPKTQNTSTAANTQAGATGAPVTTTTGPSSASSELTRAELKAMMPSKKALRREGRSRNFKSLQFGYTSNRNAARASTLLNVSRSDLDVAGRVSGYEAAYWDGCGGLCFPGLLNVSTQVHIFRTAAHASRFLDKHAATYRHLDGKRVTKWLRFTSAELFDPGVFGEEAIGVHSEYFLFEEETLTETLIMFRIREILGFSRAVNLEQRQYPNRQAVALAQILEERIMAVLTARRQ